MTKLLFKPSRNYCYLDKRDIRYIKVLINKQYEGSYLLFCKINKLTYKVFYKNILDNRGLVEKQYLRKIERKINHRFFSLRRKNV